MVEFRAFWPVDVTSKGSEMAKLNKIHMSGMKMLFLRNELHEDTTVEANLMPNMNINGTRIICRDEMKCIKLTRIEDFAFETEAVLAHYKAIGNVTDGSNLDGIYVVCLLTNLFENSLQMDEKFLLLGNAIRLVSNTVPFNG